MMSSLVNAVLFIALVMTSVCVLLMYRKLKSFEAHQSEYKRAFSQTSEALKAAGNAVQTFSSEGRGVLSALESKIEEARSVIAELEARDRQSQARDRATQKTDQGSKTKFL
ncbi:hypothetical protein [Microvirga lenta]|uniref:hypothetical protein n=1 Tax=Microvirga lenta TaxID=2881337 RepID=UPI001CFF9C42|nr:hypothetical protein [Microvirga lenta]MCB5177721.1 hypothetical protein [Microvirga lenta]